MLCNLPASPISVTVSTAISSIIIINSIPGRTLETPRKKRTKTNVQNKRQTEREREKQRELTEKKTEKKPKKNQWQNPLHHRHLPPFWKTPHCMMSANDGKMMFFSGRSLGKPKQKQKEEKKKGKRRHPHRLLFVSIHAFAHVQFSQIETRDNNTIHQSSPGFLPSIW
ncbi:hypothetical protein B0T22DRAFT_47188 [Podospora appendiculata]|uniref:Uncharacterized protein n=1 Tax=Podospora appendiculata TaxID=314037 RepID=A0AAE0XI31_9PEZI|nr:hypothetical protein B0T22DRAFT_47188 [Podospora appendiculata]